MKSLKTYNMDQDCIQILQHKPNKSQYVCRAIRRMQKLEEDFDLINIETRILMIHLKNRAAISPQLKALLQHEIQS